MFNISHATAFLQASPSPSVLLEPGNELIIKAANQAYLEAVETTENNLVGKSIFGIFSPATSPEHKSAIEELHRSFQQVMVMKSAHQMEAQQFYIIPQNAGNPQVRHWVPLNTPILDDDGEVCMIIHSFLDITKQKWLEAKKDHAFTKLNERIKEQSCLYRISRLDEYELSIDELLTEAAMIMPTGWQYPEDAAAIIEFGDQTYKSPGYEETKWTLAAENKINKEYSLAAKVTYLKEDPISDKWPFIKEEKNLLNSITSLLALKVNKILLKQELRAKHALLEKTYRLANIGTWTYDIQNDHLVWSNITKEVHGFDHDYKPDVESTVQLFKEGYDRDTFAQAVKEALENFKPFDVELKIISGQGDERWIRATGEPEFHDGVCTRFYGISQNVSNRKIAEEHIKYNEQRFKALVQDGSDLIAILDEHATYLYVSPTSQRILGTPPGHYIGTNALSYIHEDDINSVKKALESFETEKRVQLEPYRFKDSNGNWRWIETVMTNMLNEPAVKGLVANSRDVTEQKRNHQKLLDYLKEKEALLAEIHHRVKNNMAVISGLMQLQAYEEENTEARDRLIDSVARIKTIANIHEQLYQTNNFLRLDLPPHIKNMVSNLMETFLSQASIDIDYQCEAVHLNINQAIPFSLIMNEVISNILKHAFPGKKKGKVEITLKEQERGNKVFLTVKDNGIGFPDNTNATELNSLGMNLINDLCYQLDAGYAYESTEEGTTFHMHFAKTEPRMKNIELSV